MLTLLASLCASLLAEHHPMLGPDDPVWPEVVLGVLALLGWGLKAWLGGED